METKQLQLANRLYDQQCNWPVRSFFVNAYVRADQSFDASVTRAGEPATERVVPANDQVEVVQIEFTKFSALPDEERKNVVPKGGSAYSSLQPAFDKLSRLVTNAESFYVLSQLLAGVETEMMAQAGDTTSHARKVTKTVAGVASTLEIDNRQKDIRQLHSMRSNTQKIMENNL